MSNIIEERKGIAMIQGGWDYNWIGEFGEKDNFRWDVVNQTGNRSSQTKHWIKWKRTNLVANF